MALLNAGGELCGAFLWRALEQSGFDDSIRRMQCDHKPILWRKRLDLSRSILKKFFLQHKSVGNIFEQAAAHRNFFFVDRVVGKISYGAQHHIRLKTDRPRGEIDRLIWKQAQCLSSDVLAGIATIPPVTAPWRSIEDFALTLDGYKSIGERMRSACQSGER